MAQFPDSPEDPALSVVSTISTTLRQCFNPTDVNAPPVGGGSTTVRVLAGAVMTQSMWDNITEGGQGCDEPLLWVRLKERYRSKTFPEPIVDDAPCGWSRVAAFEIGVARCTSMEQATDWDAVTEEAGIGLDDSWRLDLAACAISDRLTEANHLVGIDTCVPYGPEGGVVAWTIVVYVRL